MVLVKSFIFYDNAGKPKEMRIYLSKKQRNFKNNYPGTTLYLLIPTLFVSVSADKYATNAGLMHC